MRPAASATTLRRQAPHLRSKKGPAKAPVRPARFRKSPIKRVGSRKVVGRGDASNLELPNSMTNLAKSMSAPISLDSLLGPSATRSSRKARRKQHKGRDKSRNRKMSQHEAVVPVPGSAHETSSRRARRRIANPRQVLEAMKQSLALEEVAEEVNSDDAASRPENVNSPRHPPTSPLVHRSTPTRPAKRAALGKRTRRLGTKAPFERRDVAAKDARHQHGRWNVRVYAWGCGAGGRLGTGNERTASAPVVAATTNATTGDRVIPAKLACGDTHTLMLSLSGLVYSCGRGTASGQTAPNKATTRLQQVPGLDGISVADLACGELHSAVVTQGGNLYMWGDPANGRLGLGPNTAVVRTPTLVPVLARKQVIAVACGQRHTVAITMSNAVFSWGAGKAGQVCPRWLCFVACGLQRCVSFTLL